MAIITRKIEIYVHGDKAYKDEAYKKLYHWQECCFRVYNYTTTHAYVQQNMKEFSYLQDDIKVKLTDRKIDLDGIFNTSAINTTYRLASNKFKGDCPMNILSAAQNDARKKLSKKQKDLYLGKVSLPNYKRDVPIPASKQNCLDALVKIKGGNYHFNFNGINMRTNFGRDLSGNQLIMDRAMCGEYKLCDSSIQIKKNKMFLLAVFEFKKDEIKLDTAKEMFAELGPIIPILVTFKNNTYKIGDKEEFLYRRNQIRAGHERLKISMRYNNGSHGRKKKMAATEKYHEMERNYINTRIHQYTSKLIAWCIEQRCGKLILVDQEIKEEIAKQDTILLSNWGYYGMKEKLAYKCAMYGIELIAA